MKNKHVLTKASKYTFLIGKLKNKLLFNKNANNTKTKNFTTLIIYSIYTKLKIYENTSTFINQINESFEKYYVKNDY